LDPQQTLRIGRNLMYVGLNALGIRPGTRTQLTLVDDQMDPEPVTSVVAIRQFADGALAIAHSTATKKCYLYRLNATMDGWYDGSGVLTAPTDTAEPIGVLWTDMTSPPDVQIDEGLGIAYIANTGAIDKDGLYWATKTYEDFGVIDDLLVNGTGGTVGSDVAYANGVVSYNQHLWIFGYGAGSTPGFTSYRPELARFSRPNFGPFQVADSITLGDSVRSLRERIIAGAVADDALYLGGSSMITRITGSGRDSWYRQILDRSYGFVGPKCFVTVGRALYYWSPRGPMRIVNGTPDPLWDGVPETVSKVANVAKVTAAFDVERDQVLFFFDAGTGVRTFCAFDTQRDVWLGPDNDIGLTIACAGVVSPVYQSTIEAPIGPAGPPAIVSTTNVGNSTAIATWTNGDPLAQTEVSYRVQGTTTYTTVPLVAAGSTQYTFSGLAFNTPYEWRVRHVRNGQFSTYDGPEAASQFTTTNVTLLPPSGFSAGQINPPNRTCQANWVNSGEEGVSTEVWVRQVSPTSGSFYRAATVGPGISSATFVVASYGTWQGHVRHTKPGATASAYSSTSNFPVSDKA